MLDVLLSTIPEDASLMLSPESAGAAMEAATLLGRAWMGRFSAELAQRESEWMILLEDARSKKLAWLEAASIILVRGRADFAKGRDSMLEQMNAWRNGFEDSYAQKTAAWQCAALEMTEDKLAWVDRASKAADSQSGGTMLEMVGAEAERYARLADTRSVSDMGLNFGCDAALEEVMAMAGIGGLESAFQGLNGSAATIASGVRAGAKGASLWDSMSLRLSATQSAQEMNTRLAAAQAALMAQRAREAAEMAVRGLDDSVNKANSSMARNMDETFLRSAKWQRSGDSYVKDVVVHSTVLDQRITERASVKVYSPYQLMPWSLKTELSDDVLEGIDPFAIREIVRRIQDEVRVKSESIFGSEADASETAIASRTTIVRFYRSERMQIGLERIPVE
ncbi:MAG TPA: hypothetical protein PLC54_07460, partial [Spirochaetales bacterium]|nr:hypothetical protein [Spirochaetales bacterium]